MKSEIKYMKLDIWMEINYFSSILTIQWKKSLTEEEAERHENLLHNLKWV